MEAETGANQRDAAQAKAAQRLAEESEEAEIATHSGRETTQLEITVH